MSARGLFVMAATSLALVAAVLAWPTQPVAAQTAEEIRSFAVDLEVREDGVLAVTEHIEYFFPTERHGIYRDIPVEYRDDRGRTYRIPVTVTGVVDEQGTAWPYEIENGRSGLRVRIGDPNQTISGTRYYVITYELRGALRYFADHDELYWNVTGNGWEVPISRVSAVVRLPEAVPSASMTTKCYTGVSGSTRSDCVAATQGTVANFASDGFGPGEGLTIVVGWAPGLIAKIYPEYPNPWRPYLVYLLPLAVLTVMYALWRKNGRDPIGRQTLVVQYEPPDKLPPAAVGTLIDDTANVKEVTATIVDLAVRGYLRINETESHGLILTSKDYEFERVKDWQADGSLRNYEREILKTIFGLGDKVPVSQLKERYAFSTALPVITKQMYESTVTDGYFTANPEAVRKGFIGGAVGAAALGWFIGVSILALLNGNMAHAAVAWYGTCIIVFVFGWFMPRKTEKGVIAHEHAEGFREYLKTAEKYRLQWQEKENIFEKFLPYAMVFGVVGKWAKAFEGMTLPQPDWYHGQAFSAGVFNAAMFESAFNSINTSMNSAVLSSPSRSGSGSGFGGGGFSGGGGGGGGGGSW